MMRTVKLGDVCKYVNDKVSVSALTLDNYVSTENLLPDKAGLVCASSLPKTVNTTQYSKNDVLISNIRPYFKKIWKADKTGGASNDVLVLRPTTDEIAQEYLYYVLADDRFFQWSTASSSGSKMPRGDKWKIMQYELALPEPEEQQRIAEVLGSLDEKIELARQMNQTLEAIGQTLFRHHFITNPEAEKWEPKPLDEVADFLNGLAMQKYPRVDSELTLPVIKIREMSNGITDSTDIANANIPQKYIIHDGDLLFSWSGTLIVKFWTGGTGALNQHLFKVTSRKYPEWFYYYWTQHHLDEFIRIAKSKATTMGHIQRKHLKNSMVRIAPDMDDIGLKLEPIIAQIKVNNRQVQTLVALRDRLLPKLISGKVEV